MKAVIIDNYDSFTYNLYHLIRETGTDTTVLRNDAFDLKDIEAYDKIILSPGPGIPEESRDKLFDMFYTLGKTRSDGRRGLGLGLALCRSIVAAHGGVIDVQNAAPHGACFRFTLPRTEVTLYE